MTSLELVLKENLTQTSNPSLFFSVWLLDSVER